MEEGFLKFIPSLNGQEKSEDDDYTRMVNFMVMAGNKAAFVEKQARSQIRINHVFGLREGMYALNAAPQHLGETVSRSPESIFNPISLSD